MCYFEEEEQLKEVHVVVNPDSELIEIFTSETLAQEYARIAGGTIHKKPLDPKTSRRWAVNFRLEEYGRLKVFINEAIHQYGVNNRFEPVEAFGQWCVYIHDLTKEGAEEKAKELFKELVK